MNSLEAHVARQLVERITEDMRARTEALLNGSAISQRDASATAQAYCEAVGYIRALQTVLIIVQEINDELTGRAKKR